MTVVSFHAHPDDEALLCGGTLAALAAQGRRVVLVVATDGEAGLADTSRGPELAARRRGELGASAAALGVAHTVRLGYADSGMHGEAGGEQAFSRQPVEAVASRLAALLRGERAEVLTVYDPAGGYGHPDHVMVHRAGTRAAELAGTPVVLQATVDRGALVRALSLLDPLRRLLRLPADLAPGRFRAAFTASADVTHTVDVRPHLAAKRAAMRAHASQSRGGSDVRTLALLLRLPGPLGRRVLGREWFVAVRPPLPVSA